MATSIPVVQATSPVPFELRRRGGCIILARFDVWRGEQLVASVLLQKVKQAHEIQHQSLPPGQYVCALQVRVEESLNGLYALQVAAGGQPLGAVEGNVNTTPDPHDARVLEMKFELRVQ